MQTRLYKVEAIINTICGQQLFFKNKQEDIKHCEQSHQESKDWRKVTNQENVYASNRRSRFIEQTNEATYHIEERERLGIDITDDDKPITTEQRKKEITRIRKSFTRIEQSNLMENAKEAILINNSKQKMMPFNEESH